MNKENNTPIFQYNEEELEKYYGDIIVVWGTRKLKIKNIEDKLYKIIAYYEVAEQRNKKPVVYLTKDMYNVSEGEE